MALIVDGDVVAIPRIYSNPDSDFGDSMIIDQIPAEYTMYLFRCFTSGIIAPLEREDRTPTSGLQNGTSSDTPVEQADTASPAADTDPSDKMYLRPNDRLMFKYGINRNQGIMLLSVSEDGTISFPRIGPVSVVGLTKEEAANAIEAVLRAKNSFKAGYDVGPGAVNPSLQPLAVVKEDLNTPPARTGEKQTPPVQFAIVAASYSGRQLIDAFPATLPLDITHSIRTPLGTCVPLLPGGAFGPSEITNGQMLVMLSDEPENIVAWDQIRGNLSVTKTENGLALNFDGSLKNRMPDFSSRNRGQYMAIIVDGKVITTTMIRMKYDGSMVIEDRIPNKYIEDLIKRLE